MTFTIEELEALKEGTTPGPWGVDDSDPDWPILTGPLILDGNLLSQEILADLGGELSDPNFHMILATPALLDQLIAEKRAHQRLREEIEALRDLPPMITERMYDGHLSSWMRDYPADLTRILEDDNE